MSDDRFDNYMLSLIAMLMALALGIAGLVMMLEGRHAASWEICFGFGAGFAIIALARYVLGRSDV